MLLHEISLILNELMPCLRFGSICLVCVQCMDGQGLQECDFELQEKVHFANGYCSKLDVFCIIVFNKCSTKILIHELSIVDS